MDYLVQLQFAFKEGRGRANFYSLTRRGAIACYWLFNEQFHPDHGNYELIEPRAGAADAYGNFTPHTNMLHIHQQIACLPAPSSSSSGVANNEAFENLAEGDPKEKQNVETKNVNEVEMHFNEASDVFSASIADELQDADKEKRVLESMNEHAVDRETAEWLYAVESVIVKEERND